MDPVSVAVTIARPREEVFEYLADIANHAEFTDHYLVEWRLTREDPYGLGAGARYKVRAPLSRFSWADSAIVEFDRPRRIVEAGRTGKFNRIRTLGVYELEPGPGNSTRVTFTLEIDPKLPSDRLLEALGGRIWVRRQSARALRRLCTILEQDRGRGRRATVAAG